MKKLSQEDKAGLYLTVIVHLAVTIVLLVVGLGYSLNKENSFVLDFSKYDELEKMQAEAEKLRKEAEFKESISKKLQEELGGEETSEIKSVAVNRGSLKDDRGTDADQLYKDAERLQKERKVCYEVSPDEVAALAQKTDRPKQNNTRTE